MDPERFSRLLDAYGGDEARWPVDLRDAARQLLASEPQARARLAAARALDRCLDAYAVAPPPPPARILAALPRRGALERLLAWLLPDGAAALWRPSLAAALPLALGIALGAALPPAGDGAGGWELPERELLGLPDTGELP